MTIAALRAGIGLTEVETALADECRRAGLPVIRSPRRDSVLMARELGIPLAEILVAQVHARRASDFAAVRLATSELGERLLVPLGMCVLPSFLLLSVVPVVADLLVHSGLGIDVG